MNPKEKGVGDSAREAPSGHERSATRRRDIYLNESTRDEIDEYLSADTKVERGGVLVGDFDNETNATYVTASIEAKFATSQPASLTFTHETWEYINDVLARDHSGSRIVGWYHSHPHFGVFLSEYDEFIQTNFFNQPWQVAYVVDPLLGQSGFFGWEDNQIVRYSTWRTYADHSGDEGGSIREPDRGQNESGPQKSPPRPTGRVALILAGVIAGAIVGVVLGRATEAMPSPRVIDRAVCFSTPNQLPSPCPPGVLGPPSTRSPRAH